MIARLRLLPLHNVKSNSFYVLERGKSLVKQDALNFLLDGPRVGGQEAVVDVTLFAGIDSHEVAAPLVLQH